LVRNVRYYVFPTCSREAHTPLKYHDEMYFTTNGFKTLEMAWSTATNYKVVLYNHCNLA